MDQLCLIQRILKNYIHNLKVFSWEFCFKKVILYDKIQTPCIFADGLFCILKPQHSALIIHIITLSKCITLCYINSKSQLLILQNLWLYCYFFFVPLDSGNLPFPLLRRAQKSITNKVFFLEKNYLLNYLQKKNLLAGCGGSHL